MKYNSDIHHRRSIRLKGYDYSQTGMYFVTNCTQNRECLFGDMVDGAMQVNAAGRMIKKWWLELNNKFPVVQTDEFIVMPNHIHGIVIIVGADLCVCPGEPDAQTEPDTCRDMDAQTNLGAHIGAPLPEIVQWFKTMTTNEYIRGVKQHGWSPFPGKLWQRNYYEHIVRNENELNQIREYIINNPLQWELDRENPNRRGDACVALTEIDDPW